MCASGRTKIAHLGAGLVRQVCKKRWGKCAKSVSGASV